jgi:hypothetical protein
MKKAGGWVWLILPWLLAGAMPAQSTKDTKQPATPLPHAHNDYMHERPLLDALANGFSSVEADVFLVNGELLIGHDQSQLRPGKTLTALYLEPLSQRIKAQGGRVQKDAETFYLLIDFKTDGETTYTALKNQLKPYHSLLSAFDDSTTKINALTIIISGNRPKSTMAKESQRWVGYDGRVSDLANKPNRHLIPWISDNWRSHFRWDGRGNMPAEEQRKLESLVQQVHANGQMLRLWAVPDTPASWTVQQNAGVDFINSDRLEDLAKFLNTQESKK